VSPSIAVGDYGVLWQLLAMFNLLIIHTQTTLQEWSCYGLF